MSRRLKPSPTRCSPIVKSSAKRTPGPNVRDAYVAGGITGAPNASLSFSELKEAAAMEQYGETMGWSTRE